MPLIAQRAVMAAKQETVEGTAETLVNTDAFLVYEPSFDEVTDIHDRDPFRPTLSQMSPVTGKRYGVMTFKVELKGSGTAGTAPEWGKLLKFCKMAETVVPATSVTYLPASTADPSGTIAFYVDGKRYQIVGARGTWRFSANVGEFVLLEFTFWGAKPTITDTAILTGTTFNSTIPQAVLSTLFTFHSLTTHIVETVEIDIANSMALRPSIAESDGIKSVLIPTRRPVGSMKVEETLVGTFDFYGRLYAGTTGNYSLTLGATAGNIVVITAPVVRIIEIGQEFRDGILVLNVGLMFVMSAGDDEISIALT
jgi:hypothetical protein